MNNTKQKDGGMKLSISDNEIESNEVDLNVIFDCIFVNCNSSEVSFMIDNPFLVFVL